jgi:hypothetical protein
MIVKAEVLLRAQRGNRASVIASKARQSHKEKNIFLMRLLHSVRNDNIKVLLNDIIKLSLNF